MCFKTTIFEPFRINQSYYEGVFAATMSRCIRFSGLAISASHSILFDTNSIVSRDRYEVCIARIAQVG